MRAVIVVTIILALLFVVGGVIREVRQERAYTRVQQACQAYAREHVPDVDPVAWCEP